MVQYLKSLYAEWQRRKQIASTINELSKLSTKELHDIGIGRGDIYTIAHSNFPRGA